MRAAKRKNTFAKLHNVKKKQQLKTVWYQKILERQDIKRDSTHWLYFHILDIHFRHIMAIICHTNII